MGLDQLQLSERQKAEIANRLFEWLGDEEDRQKAADRRNRDLIQVHREGWRDLSGAVLKGLGLIADAIRASNR